MGRDVEHPDGNLLLRLGFARQSAPTPRGPSRYRRAEAGDCVVVWRCGLLLQTAGDCHLLLRGLAPAAVTEPGVAELYDQSEVLAAWQRGSPSPPGALACAARWFADYERAVTAAVGVGHRAPRPGPRPALAPPRPCSLERRWRRLGDRLLEDRLVADRLVEDGLAGD